MSHPGEVAILGGGVSGIAAQKLLEKYDSLEGLLEHTDELKGKQKERVIEFAEQGRMSKVLATIDTNVPVDVDFDYDTYGGGVEDFRAYSKDKHNGSKEK